MLPLGDFGQREAAEVFDGGEAFSSIQLARPSIMSSTMRKP
jgi:hypothetical protein